jgi:agmatinase
MNYYCANSEFKKSNIVLLGVPYDGTSSYRPGSRFAPDAIREASYGIESFSPYQRKDLRDLKICDLDNIPLSFGDKELNFKIIESFVQKIVYSRKKLISIGGEHLISYPIIKAFKKKYKDICVLHIDAHSDLIDTYRGERFSHATVMKRVGEIVGFENLFQLGIRSMNKSDFVLPYRDKNMHLFDLSKISEFIEQIGDKPAYVSLDLDVLDPSIFPGTGTPEPGGVDYKELLECILKFQSFKKVVGADIVELSPHYDASGVSSVVAASALRELLLAI